MPTEAENLLLLKKESDKEENERENHLFVRNIIYDLLIFID